MPIEIINDQMADMIMALDFTPIWEVICQRILDELKQEVEEIVYNSYSPKYYERQGENGGLLGDFTKLDQSTVTQYSTETIIHNEIGETEDTIAGMTNIPVEFIHGSNYWDGGTDIRDILIDLVTQESGFGSGPLFGEGIWREPRDFWASFINKLDNGRIEEMFEEELRNRGIPYRVVIA